MLLKLDGYKSPMEETVFAMFARQPLGIGLQLAAGPGQVRGFGVRDRREVGAHEDVRSPNSTFFTSPRYRAGRCMRWQRMTRS